MFFFIEIRACFGFRISDFGFRILLLGAALALAGCGRTKSDGPDHDKSSPDRVKRIDRSLTKAAQFLVVRQDSRDGAWRSDNYAALKDGPSLASLVLQALRHAPASGNLDTTYRKAVDYLAALARNDGSIDEGEHGLSYPVYTAAGAVLVLTEARNVRHVKARDAWLAYLRKRQLTEDLGWVSSDKEYGGWGYSIGLPTKANREPLTESNISATVAALEALRAAGCPATDSAFARALTFVKRCQNYSAKAETRNPAFDDGGFFFIYDDANRNKAGLAGKEDSGRERFRSYGSATADGLRCLLACGLPKDHPRVAGARRWLGSRFQADANPGDFPEERESRRVGVYFYYARSVARALREVAGNEVQTLKGKVSWAEALADVLISRQEKDGSWKNPVNFYQEDDAVLATSLARIALAVCREVISGK
jgi:squalene-hopene/tetraprenyl-beta-curcumene cyclase